MSAADLDVIENSLRMLPAWAQDRPPEDQPPGGGTPCQWWVRFAELSGYGLTYLYEKLIGIVPELRTAEPRRVCDAAAYLLMFFDSPAVHEHLDVVAAWDPKVPGRAGQRWAEAVCAAAWRLLVANGHSVHPGSHFTSIPWAGR